MFVIVSVDVLETTTPGERTTSVCYVTPFWLRTWHPRAFR